MTYDEYMKIIQKDLSHWLESGINVWQSPWTSARNADTGRKYGGINAWYLTAVAAQLYDGDPRFFSFAQAKKHGYSVRKGEHGHPAYFFKSETTLEDKKNEDGSPVLDEKGNPVKEEVSSRPIFKSYIVFNARQLYGIPEYKPEEEAFDGSKAEEYISNSPVEILQDQLHRAFYSGGDDKIHIPPKNLFKTLSGYYSTIFHEMVHSTGTDGRLRRKSLLDYANDRAREELIAELGAVMLCDSVNMKYQNENSAAYIQGWAQALKDEEFNFALFYRDVSQAIRYISYPGNRMQMHEYARALKDSYDPSSIDTSSGEDRKEDINPNPAIDDTEPMDADTQGIAQGIYVEFHNSDFKEIKEDDRMPFKVANDLLRELKEDSTKSGWDSVEYDIHYTGEDNHERVYSSKFLIGSDSTDLVSDLLNNAKITQDNPERLSEHVELLKCIEKATSDKAANPMERAEEAPRPSEESHADPLDAREYPYVEVTNSTLKGLYEGDVMRFSDFNDLLCQASKQRHDRIEHIRFKLHYVLDGRVQRYELDYELGNQLSAEDSLLSRMSNLMSQRLFEMVEASLKRDMLGKIYFQVPELEGNNLAALRYSVSTVPLKEADFFMHELKGKIADPDSPISYHSANAGDGEYRAIESSRIPFGADLYHEEDGKTVEYHIDCDYDLRNDDSVFTAIKRNAWEKLKGADNPFLKSDSRDSDREYHEKILYTVVPALERRYHDSITPQQSYISIDSSTILSMRYEKLSNKVSYKTYEVEKGKIARIQDAGSMESNGNMEEDFKELCQAIPEISRQGYRSITDFQFKSLENDFNAREDMKAEKIRKLTSQGTRARDLLQGERDFARREYLRYICDYASKSIEDVYYGKEPSSALSEDEFKRKKQEEVKETNPDEYTQRVRWDALQAIGEAARRKIENATGDDKKYLQYVIDFQQKSLDVPEAEWLRKTVFLPLDQNVYMKKLEKESKEKSFSPCKKRW